MEFKKWKILPGMAVKGVRSDKSAYDPYIMAGSFAVFIYFVFSSILCNDLTKTLPHAAYAWVFLEIGRWLLGVILLIFLFYANSFLIRRRKKELGLYSLLGLEKKHLAVMLFLETALLYVLILSAGILLGTVLSKLLFLLLLRLSNLSVEAEFVFAPEAFRSTLFYFAVVFLINYLRQLWELSRANPIELLSEGKKGEREPRLLFFRTVLGAGALALGYVLAVRSRIDSFIFTNFFFAVFWVIVGTELLFTSGSVAFLKLAKRRRGFYYRPANFITVSGMYYRMKKGAASLVNLCIFSTMVLITLICTFSLYIGIEDITRYMSPYDYTADFGTGQGNREEALKKLSELEGKYGLELQRADCFEEICFSCEKKENKFVPVGEETAYADIFDVGLITLEDYRRLTNDPAELNEGEVLIYSTGADFGYESVEFMGLQHRVLTEAEEIFPFPKAGVDTMNTGYIIAVRDQEMMEEFADAWGKKTGAESTKVLLDGRVRRIGILLEGKDQEKKALVREFSEWCQGQEGFWAQENGLERRSEQRSMYGGLLFIGIVFGLIFFMCLLIIMYYKQLSEGYEDQGSFDIMQKVGMSDEETRQTIHRQILLVFALPLAGAISHTMAGMFMVKRLLAVICFFNDRLLTGCIIGVSAVFAVIYGVSYLITSGAYYRIVKRHA